MFVIVVANQKGGAGKTTLASHLAVEAGRTGLAPVAIIDTDPQGGLADWFKERADREPQLVTPKGGGLGMELARLRTAGAALVIIDTPPAITATIAATLQEADLVVVPARPSPNDLRAIGGTLKLVLAAKKPLVFVMNAVKPRVRIALEAAVLLSQYGTVAPAQLSDRTDYAVAMTDGRTAPELEPDGKAAVEIASLWAYLRDRLEGKVAHVR